MKKTIGVCAGVFFMGSIAAQADTVLWDGGAGTEITNAVNWSEDKLPSISTGTTGVINNVTGGVTGIIKGMGLEFTITGTTWDTVRNGEMNLSRITLGSGAVLKDAKGMFVRGKSLLTLEEGSLWKNGRTPRILTGSIVDMKGGSLVAGEGLTIGEKALDRATFHFSGGTIEVNHNLAIFSNSVFDWNGAKAGTLIVHNTEKEGGDRDFSDELADFANKGLITVDGVIVSAGFFSIIFNGTDTTTMTIAGPVTLGMVGMNSLRCPDM